MPEVYLRFCFGRTNNFPIQNHDLYAIRRQLARTFENSEFGNIIEHDDRFMNTNANPIRDRYYTPENILIVTYSFGYPLLVGNLARLLTEGVPELQRYITENFENIEMKLRYEFS